MITAIFFLILCVLVQSIFGVGLLVFGTPMLLLWGLEFTSALGLLLPSSIVISTLQLLSVKSKPIIEFRMSVFAILGIIVGIAIFFNLNIPSQLPVIMFFTMLLISLLRSIPKFNNATGKILYQYRSLFHFFNAIFHGFTNQGGTLLSVYSTFAYQEKNMALRCTSFFYLIYAISQISILVLFDQKDKFLIGMILMPITAVLYIFIGKQTFLKINQAYFSRLATLFCWLVALVFFVKIPAVEKLLNL